MVKITHKKGESLPQEYLFSSPSRKRKENKKQEMEVLSTNSLTSEIDRLINSSSIGKDFHYVPIYREHESLFCKKKLVKYGREKRSSADHARSKSDICPSNGIKFRSEEEGDSIKLGSGTINEDIKDVENNILENEETGVTNTEKDQIEGIKHMTNNTNGKKEYHIPNSDRLSYLECDEIDENIKDDLALETDDTYAALMEFIGPKQSVNEIYTDGAEELKRAVCPSTSST